MDKSEVIKKLIQYKSLVAEHFDINKMLLYGSYSINKQTEDSDIDVAIVVNSLNGDYFEYTPKLWKLRRKIDHRIEPIIFKKGADDPSGFYNEILKTGIEI
jgi:predicted nucleotidyltransferase